MWGKIDDGLAMHPKVVAAGNTAMGLWVRCLAYCTMYQTDGRLSLATVRTLDGRKRDIHRLVDCGLWELSDGEIQFHDWADWQITKAQYEAKKSVERDKKRRQRERVVPGGQVGDSPALSRRPDQTRPEPISNPPLCPPAEVSKPVGFSDGASAPEKTAMDSEVPHSGSAPRQRGRRRLIALPDGWCPSVEHEKQAAGYGVDVALEAEAFRAHAHANDRRLADWDAGFTMWLTRAKSQQAYAVRRRGGSSQDDLFEELHERNHGTREELPEGVGFWESAMARIEEKQARVGEAESGGFWASIGLGRDAGAAVSEPSGPRGGADLSPAHDSSRLSADEHTMHPMVYTGSHEATEGPENHHTQEDTQAPPAETGGNHPNTQGPRARGNKSPAHDSSRLSADRRPDYLKAVN